ncbi:hypothetical protein EGW08_019881 [Elysia chlorotica]|uniref:Fibrinogen C-terminal domain-containing protein n=1 Tax=Elysia chlorotica TaxID=188477 RepID=A0A433SSW6_ELYCH|nr:hypothetical protein EGW08_019881 [Elysia chlorotica]
MALCDLFTTARLVTLLVMATAATDLVQRQSRNADDTSSILRVLERLDANMEGIRFALTSFIPPQHCKKDALLFHPFAPPYTVINNEFRGVNVPLLCDTATDGGGWIVIQRRTTGEVDFYRDWDSYKVGFGTTDTDFWLGNDNIHTITSTGKYELRVDLKYNGQSKFARYDRFFIDSEDDKYKLHLGSYSGTAGDSLTGHNGFRFSTFDRDYDDVIGNCAYLSHGGWWYNFCHSANINGKWGAGDDRGLAWWQFTYHESATFSEMKIRRLNM